MKLRNEEYREILEHFLSQVKERDPVGFDKLMEHINWQNQITKHTLLDAIASYTEITKMRSVYTHSETLNRLNEFITTEGNSRITGIQISLSDGEREIYGRDYIDLTPRQDFGALNQALYGLRQIIAGNEGYAHE